MSYDLGGPTKSIKLYGYLWEGVIKLAMKYGWEPAGTVFSSYEGWEGSYYANSRQLVKADDAKNLADALEKALAKHELSEDIIREDADLMLYPWEPTADLKWLQNPVKLLFLEGTGWARSYPDNGFLGIKRYSDMVEFLLEMIDLCRGGAISIG